MGRKSDRRQKLTDAVIALSSERVSNRLMHQVADFAMQMTGAHYAMISHELDGEQQFIPIGMSEDEISRLMATPPQGKGLLGGPIMFNNEQFGVLYLTEKDDGTPFTEEDERLVRTLTSACGVALANARSVDLLEQRVEERTQKLAKVNERLRQHELELELANESLRRASEFKDQFLANTSHELRTPLNAIIGFSELLTNPRMGELNTKQRKFIHNIHTSGKGLLTVINNLLDLSKIESGMMDLNHESCHPALVLEGVREVMQPLADKKSITLTTVCALPDEKSVFSDPGKLRQILINLVGNAIKFTHDGGTITMQLQSQTQGAKLLLQGTIIDNGQGVSEEDQTIIFKPFVQAESGLTRSHGGTGLGLSLTRKLVRMMGGDVEVQSTLGEGSTFSFTIAVEAGDDEAIGHTLENMVSMTTSTTQIETSTQSVALMPILTYDATPVVLVVDEDHERGASVVSILQRGNYTAIQTDMEQVNEVATAYDPFLLLLGVPKDPVEMYQALQHLRSMKCTRDLPVTLLGGTAADPSFSFGTIDSVEKLLSDELLSDMLSHQSFQATRQSNTSLVLVVDDEPSVCEYMYEKLTSEGYQTLLAEDGKQGLEMARVYQPDMIILDLMMPGMSGFEVVEALKRLPETADIPVKSSPRRISIMTR